MVLVTWLSGWSRRAHQAKGLLAQGHAQAGLSQLCSEGTFSGSELYMGAWPFLRTLSLVGWL